MLWVVESFEPERKKAFELKVTAPDPSTIHGDVESILRRHEVACELRSAGPKGLCYETSRRVNARTDRIANAILRLDAGAETEVVWDEKKTT